MAEPNADNNPPLMVRGDIDGFFGLFIDNLLQLMMIYVLCRFVCGMTATFVNGTILPGQATELTTESDQPPTDA